MIEITTLAKTGGPLTKSITLQPDGSLLSDGSACVMDEGTAQRGHFDDLHAFARCIAGLAPHQAIALGALRRDLPDTVSVVTKGKLQKLNGSADAGTVARTADHIAYVAGRPALALIDIDTKGMPDAVRARIAGLGGFWPALVSVIPELEHTARVVRRSTSTGISRTDTGEVLPGSAGQHIYLLVQDGADIERFLYRLHERCWLAGLGWLMVGAGGQLLDRSLIDRTVCRGERLVFEGPPILVGDLIQDAASRSPVVAEGAPLDTVAVCPGLRIVEQARLAELKAKESHRLAPERAKVREEFITEHAKRVAKATGISPDSAKRMVERQCEGVLLPDIELPFDSADLRGSTVADVLADPEKFVGATLSDPLEGPSYGVGKAKIMQRSDGALWIHSFAHGRTVYEIKHSAASIEALLAKVPDNEAVSALVRLVAAGDVQDHDRERLRDAVSARSGIGRRTIDRAIEKAKHEQADRARQAEKDRRIAERADPRPQMEAPAPDAPWLPQMEVLNDVLGQSRALEPPMRDIEGCMAEVRVRSIPSMHALTPSGSNESEVRDSRLPAPEYPLLTRLDEAALGELIERHIDYTDAVGRHVHLAAPFVKHFLVRSDKALPTATAVATLPMVLADGTILSGRGLNRVRAIVFRVPKQLQALLPSPDECGSTHVAEAMRFLTDEFLCDVAADYPAKCVLVAAAATILERLLLPERPAFFIPAGQRGGGKTTTANMISVAALGRRAAAAAWSANEEERRKALFAYLAEGAPLICWDNIPRGAAISCQSIEKALTADLYSDRVLGGTEIRTVPATTVHIFTGNNVAPRGDLASRSFTARLSCDRADPENRTFKHPDPIGWTEANRGQILRALYTILLGNPRLQSINPPAAETRFKAWWHLVGSAVEYAAQQHADHVASLTIDSHPDAERRAVAISFKRMLLDGEQDEEQTSSLNTVLDVLRAEWRGAAFKASELALRVGQADERWIEFRSALEQASGKPLKVVTASAITRRLKAIIDAPVLHDKEAIALRYTPDKSGNGGDFQVRNAGH